MANGGWPCSVSPTACKQAVPRGVQFCSGHGRVALAKCEGAAWCATSLKEHELSRGFLMDLWAYSEVRSRGGIVCGVFSGYPQDAGKEFGRSSSWSRSWLRGSCAVLFVRGGTPTHPFVNTSGHYGSRSGPGGPTPNSLLRPSRTARRLNQADAPRLTRSPSGTSDCHAGEGLFPEGKGRCNRVSISLASR
jgi:hypothetical protein